MSITTPRVSIIVSISQAFCAYSALAGVSSTGSFEQIQLFANIYSQQSITAQQAEGSFNIHGGRPIQNVYFNQVNQWGFAQYNNRSNEMVGNPCSNNLSTASLSTPSSIILLEGSAAIPQ